MFSDCVLEDSLEGVAIRRVVHSFDDSGPVPFFDEACVNRLDHFVNVLL